MWYCSNRLLFLMGTKVPLLCWKEAREADSAVQDVHHYLLSIDWEPSKKIRKLAIKRKLGMPGPGAELYPSGPFAEMWVVGGMARELMKPHATISRLTDRIFSLNSSTSSFLRFSKSRISFSLTRAVRTTTALDHLTRLNKLKVYRLIRTIALHLRIRTIC